MLRITMQILYFSFANLLFLPLKLINTVFTSRKNYLIISIADSNLGHNIYVAHTISMIQNENVKIRLVVSEKYFDYYKYVIKRPNVYIYKDFEVNWSNFFSWKMPRIIYAPYTSRHNLLSLSVFASSFFIKTPFSPFYFTSKLGPLSNLLICFFFLFSFNFSIIISREKNLTIERFVQEYFSRIFKLSNQNFHKHKKEKMILINVCATDENRDLVFQPIESLIEFCKSKKIASEYKIIFIGSGERASNITKKMIETINIKYNIFCSNYVNKTDLRLLIELIKKAKIVFTSDTAIQHISYLFDTKTYLWLAPNTKNTVKRGGIAYFVFEQWIYHKSGVFYINSSILNKEKFLLERQKAMKGLPQDISFSVKNLNQELIVDLS